MKSPRYTSDSGRCPSGRPSLEQLRQWAQANADAYFPPVNRALAVIGMSGTLISVKWKGLSLRQFINGTVANN
ncbi:MAG TPA: hypothetical protein VN222_16590 [Novosphingobium sp.]|nr:hypothetical protein [Novosphingobium sp.]